MFPWNKKIEKNQKNRWKYNEENQKYLMLKIDKLIMEGWVDDVQFQKYAIVLWLPIFCNYDDKSNKFDIQYTLIKKNGRKLLKWIRR